MCVFCEEERVVMPMRIRCHVGGIKCAVAAYVNACTGVKRKLDETEERFDERKRQFLAARRQCKESYEQAAEEKNQRMQDRVLQDRANGLEPQQPGGRVRHKKQTSLNQHMPAGDKQAEADKELVRRLPYLLHDCWCDNCFSLEKWPSLYMLRSASGVSSPRRRVSRTPRTSPYNSRPLLRESQLKM